MSHENIVLHPNMESTPPFVSESVTNSYRQLALRMKFILGKKQNLLVDAPVAKWAFYELKDGITGLSIMAILDRESEAGKDTNLPADFILPAYTFKTIFRVERNEVVDTPYGPQPGHVKAPDGKNYTFENYFIFNENGQGARCEFVVASIHNFIENPSLQDWLNSLKTVDFAPDERDSRYVHLSDKNRTEIRKKLQLIETDQFIKR